MRPQKPSRSSAASRQSASYWAIEPMRALAAKSRGGGKTRSSFMTWSIWPEACDDMDDSQGKEKIVVGPILAHLGSVNNMECVDLSPLLLRHVKAAPRQKWKAAINRGGLLPLFNTA